MPFGELIVYLLKFYIPAVWSIAFRAVAFGYKSKRRVVFGIIAYTVYVLVIPALIITFIGYGKYTHYAGYVMTLGSMAVLLFTTDTVGKTIFLQLTQGAMVTVMSVVLNYLRTVIGFSYELLLLLLCICSPALFFVSLKFWAKPMRFLIDNIQDSIWTLLVLPLLTLIIVTYIPIYPPMTFAHHPLFCTLMMIGVETTFFLYLYTMYRNIKRIQTLSKEAENNRLLAAEIEHYRSYVDTAKANRHDLHHHDAILIERLEHGDLEGALDYLKEHDKTIMSAKLINFCPNPTINAVLRIYQRKAEALGIAYSAVADIPDNLPIGQSELGALLSNLLENAITAASKCGSGSFVAVTAQTDDSNFLLETRNSVNSSVEFRNGMPVSSKPGGGTGTVSITSTVERYNGITLYSANDNTFSVRILVPLKKDVV